MLLLAVYATVALGLSFLCSILEAVLLSLTPSYVAARDRDGTTTGVLLRKLKDDVDRPLAAILSLNTIAHTMGAAGVGAEATRLFGSAWVGVTSAILTLLILVLSEIIPKTLGARYWRELAPATARVLSLMIWLLWPLVALSAKMTSFVAAAGSQTHAVHRDELTALAELGARKGVFRADETRILRALLHLGGVRARDIMTPRTVMHALPETQTVGEVMTAQDEFRFSRLPLYGADADDLNGYVLKDDILLRAARDEHDVVLRSLKREILVMPETLPVPHVLERFLERREHIALVLDEHGSTTGLVTMEDVIETLLGMEIIDEADSVHDMQDLAHRQWKKRARALGLVPDDDEPDDAHGQPGEHGDR
jgi:CBS domain containing-hemolysin-like protein